MQPPPTSGDPANPSRPARARRGRLPGVLIAAGALGLAALVGCGGDDGEEEAPGEVASLERASQLDELAGKATPRVRGLADDLGAPVSDGFAELAGRAGALRSELGDGELPAGSELASVAGCLRRGFSDLAEAAELAVPGGAALEAARSAERRFARCLRRLERAVEALEGDAPQEPRLAGLVGARDVADTRELLEPQLARLIEALTPSDEKEAEEDGEGGDGAAGDEAAAGDPGAEGGCDPVYVEVDQMVDRAFGSEKVRGGAYPVGGADITEEQARDVSLRIVRRIAECEAPDFAPGLLSGSAECTMPASNDEPWMCTVGIGHREGGSCSTPRPLWLTSDSPEGPVRATADTAEAVVCGTG